MARQYLFLSSILTLLAIATVTAQESSSSPVLGLEAQAEEVIISQPPDSVFRYFWEFPDYKEEYDVVNRFPQFEINGGGVAYVGYDYSYNDTDDAEKQGFFSYAAFRPFILDYPDYDIAFGVSFISNIGKTRIDDVEVNLDDGVVSIFANADAIEIHSESIIVNFAALLSIPQHGIQIGLEVGHMWSYLSLAMDIDFDIDIPDILLVNGQLAGYDYEQSDRALYIALNFNKYYDRNFFSHFNFTFRWIYNLETPSRDAFGNPNLQIEVLGEEIILEGKRQKLPAFLDLQLGREIDINVISGNAYTRLFTIPTNLPIPKIGTFGISVTALGGLEHRTGEAFGKDLHGLRMIAGGILSVLELFNVVFTYTWEEYNDMNDEWGVRVVVGLYGGSGYADPGALLPGGLEPNPANIAQ